MATADWASGSDGLFDDVWSAPDRSGVRMVRTHELVEASAAMRETYPPHHLTVRRRADDFDMRLMRADCDSLQLTEFSVGADIEIFAPPVDNLYLLILPLAGRVTVGTRKESVVLTQNVGVITNTRQPYYLEHFSSDCRYACIRIEKSQVDRAVAQMAGQPVSGWVDFEFRVDLAQPNMAPVLRAIELLARELGDHSGAVSPLLSPSIAQHLVNAVVLHQPHSHTRLLEPSVRTLPSVLREAQDFMLRHLDGDITVSDVARAAIVSVRNLEEIFQRTVGLSPMAAFRQLRLSRAHDELTSAATESVTIAEVARRWGFRHQGRFAIEYRRAYGVSPSEQLRRRNPESRHVAVNGHTAAISGQGTHAWDA